MDAEAVEEFRINVKVVGGDDCSMLCRPDTTVREIKQGIENKLHIPIQEQKLIYKGKPLPDPRKLKEVGIRTDTVLYVVRIQQDTPTTSIFSTQEDVLTAEIKRYLRRFFNEAETAKIADEFMKDYNRRRANLSLDDMERLATRYL